MTENMKEIIRKQVHEIVDIVLDGNGFEARTRRETGTLPTLFMCFSGHINKLEVQLHSDGWESGVSYDRVWDFSLKDELYTSEIENMRAVIDDATEYNEAETLARDIERKEREIAETRKELAGLKKSLKKKLKAEEKKDA